MLSCIYSVFSQIIYGQSVVWLFSKCSTHDVVELNFLTFFNFSPKKEKKTRAKLVHSRTSFHNNKRKRASSALSYSTYYFDAQQHAHPHKVNTPYSNIVSFTHKKTPRRWLSLIFFYQIIYIAKNLFY